jgi:hypothetical protein
MRQKAELFTESSQTPGADEWNKAELSVADDEVEVAFLRERQRRTRS